MFSNDPLTFSGNGALEVTGNYKHCIANDDITVNGGTIHVTDAHDGLESEGTLVVADGVFALAQEDDGLVDQGTVTINGGTTGRSLIHLYLPPDLFSTG